MNLTLSTEEALELELFPFENRYAWLDSVCFQVKDLASGKHLSCVCEIEFLLMLVRDDIGINKAV